MTGSQNIRSTQTRRRSQGDFLPAAMRVVSSLIVLCALLTAGFTFYPEWTRLHDMRRDLTAQKTKLEELQKLAESREKEVHLLQTDREYLEMIARDRLDMMKDGETIFHLSSTVGHPQS